VSLKITRQCDLLFKKDERLDAVRNSLKGAFLSGLVFPGLGQIVLKQYRKGAFLIFIVLSSMVMFVTLAVRQAMAVLEKIQASGGSIDPETIARTANQVTTNQASLLLNFLLLFVIFCWFFGVIDAYMIGRRKDIEDHMIVKSRASGEN
jgi:TM2 domain-containing membrane protein YozV